MVQRLLTVDGSHAGMRLDRYLAAQLPDFSRTQLQRLVAGGLVLVEGGAAKAGQKIETGQRIVVNVPEPNTTTLSIETIPITVLYDDADVIVVDKPAGLVVHPGHGVESGTLVNALLARYPELRAFEDSKRPGIVHRLDKDTSGVMVVARTPAAYRNLQAQFAARTVKKRYWALIRGQLETERALIDATIGRSRERPTQMAVAGRAERPARTAYQVLERFEQYSFVEAQPITGRTHQIRLHFAALGHPVVGDRSYGTDDETFGLTRQFLHAHALRLTLPSSGDQREFHSPLPADLQSVLDELRRTEGRSQPTAR